jgi:hypothetical protein
MELRSSDLVASAIMCHLAGPHLTVLHTGLESLKYRAQELGRGREKLALNYPPLPPEHWDQMHEPPCLFIIVFVVVFRQCLLLNVELAKLFRLIGSNPPNYPPVSLSPALDLQVHATMPTFMWAPQVKLRSLFLGASTLRSYLLSS